MSSYHVSHDGFGNYSPEPSFKVVAGKISDGECEVVFAADVGSRAVMGFVCGQVLLTFKWRASFDTPHSTHHNLQTLLGQKALHRVKHVLCTSAELDKREDPGPQAILRILKYELGLRGRRESGPKGAWYFSFGTSPEEHRGTGKASVQFASASMSQPRSLQELAPLRLCRHGTFVLIVFAGCHCPATHHQTTPAVRDGKHVFIQHPCKGLSTAKRCRAFLLPEPASPSWTSEFVRLNTHDSNTRASLSVYGQ